MRKLFVLIFFLLTTFLLFSDIYDDFLAFKVDLYNRGYIEGIETMFEEWNANFAKMDLGEEDKLAVENLVTIERVNLMQDAKAEKKIYKMLKARETISLKYIESKKRANVGKWFLLSLGDLKVCLLDYASWLNTYSEAIEAKKYISDALKKDDKFSSAYISQALWLFFAPAIAGGSYESALESFNSAVYYASSDMEKYLALIFCSQVHFKMKHTKEYIDDLKSATALVRGEMFTKYVQKLNTERGMVFFEKRRLNINED